MTKEERRIKDPLSFRFEDCGELYATWGLVHKVVAILTLPYTIIPFLIYTLLCELEYALKPEQPST